MNKYKHKRIIRKYRRNKYSFEDNSNPLSVIANLVDVMLVLAVGIMLALIINWNVNINSEQNYKEEVNFSSNDISDSTEEVDTDSLEKMGTVYYDSNTNQYYVINGE